MTFSGIDSALTGPLFAADPMRAVFSDGARLGAMLRIEAALARAQGADDLADALDALSPEELGREAAHALVEQAAGEVRDGADDLRSALRRLTPYPIDEAFDLEPAIRAAGPWIDRALADAQQVRDRLERDG